MVVAEPPLTGPASRLRRRLRRRFYRQLFRLYRVAFPTPRWVGRIDPRSLRRILVVQRGGVGDMVLTTPLLAFLKERVPHAEIEVLASRRNAAAIAGDPAVARTFVYDETWRGWVRMLALLRRRHYDAVFTGQEGKHLREALMATAIAHRGTHKISVWRPKRYQGLFTSVARIPPRATHTAERILYMGWHAFGVREPIGGAVVGRYPPRVPVDPNAEARVDQYLAARGLGAFVAVNLSAHFAVRDWSAEPCAAFVSLVLKRHPDLSVVLTPAPGKQAVVEEVARRAASSRVILAPALPLLELVALVRRAVAVVTPNTALVHLAAACRRPVVALYAPVVPRDVALWLPIGVPYRALASALGGTSADISPELVANAFDELRREVSDRGGTDARRPVREVDPRPSASA
jgi:heptosyltransferase-3